MPEILENLPILLYDGTSDFICNWLSNYRVCENLQWPGLQNFTDQEWTSWKLSDGTYAGEFKYASNFTFLKVTSEYIYNILTHSAFRRVTRQCCVRPQVYGAGHLVPMDQPRSALEMLHIFLSGDSFASEE
jgi:cathepsin A (carboxypeptidase C)